MVESLLKSGVVGIAEIGRELKVATTPKYAIIGAWNQSSQYDSAIDFRVCYLN